MIHSSSHHLILFLIGVTFIKRTSLTIVKRVESGITVSLLCSNILTEPSYIAWFKQTNASLPLCIITQYVQEPEVDPKYLNDFKKNHIEMSTNKTVSSLKIINTDVSDSGTFYCGSFVKNHMMFHNRTQLVVVNENKQPKGHIPTEDCGAMKESSKACHVYYIMTLTLSSLILPLTVLAIVVLIRLRARNKQKQDVCAQPKDHNDKEQDLDLNYAALSISKKKSRRPIRSMREVEPSVIYAATR